MDPFGVSTGIVGLIAVALKLVVGALGMIDKTVAAYNEAADELRGLQQDLEQLQTQMVRIHGALDVLASNTKDRGFKKLLKNNRGQASVRELCKALQETLSTLTEMTDKMNEDDLRPVPLPSDRKSLEFIRAVFKHSITPLTITDLVKALREMRSNVQTCLTKLEATFQHVHTLYDMMSNGLGRTASRTTDISTSTNLSVRIKLTDWLKRWEGTWGPFGKRESTSLRGFLESQLIMVDGNSRVTDNLVAKNSRVRDLVAGYSRVTDDLVDRDFHFLQLENVTGGPSHLTDDLLGKIFDHLCGRGPLSLRHLLFVSRRFYSVTVNNAHLWTTICLDSHFFHHFNQRPEQGNRFVEHCIHRSGPLPLCLYMAFSGLNSRDLTFLLHPLETFGKPEWRGFQRCTSLIWDHRGHGAATIKKLVNVLPKSLPSLEYISLSYFGYPFVGSQFPDCPVLERVEMFDNQSTTPHFWGTNFLHVTTLCFGIGNSWANCDFTIFSLFPVLHDLTLFTRDSLHFGLPIGPRTPIIFEHLHILRVHGIIPSEVLTGFVTPTLKELHLKANDNGYTPIKELLSSFNPPCQHIHALLPETVSAREPDWATDLSKLVHKCTRTKSLYISKWMEKEYKMPWSGYGVVVLHVQ